MYLTEEDVELLDGSVDIMSKLNERIRELPIEEALMDLGDLDPRLQERYARKDKKDTKFFDIVAENTISIGDGCSGHLDL